MAKKEALARLRACAYHDKPGEFWVIQRAEKISIKAACDQWANACKDIDNGIPCDCPECVKARIDPANP